MFENNLPVKFQIEDNILIATYIVENIEVDAAKIILEKRLNTYNDRNYLAIIDGRFVKNITKEARAVLSSPEANKHLTAVALVINSSIGLYLGRFYMKLNRPLIPSNLFTSLEEAKNWLKTTDFKK